MSKHAKTLGILSIVFGSIVSVFYLFSLLSMPFLLRMYRSMISEGADVAQSRAFEAAVALMEQTFSYTLLLNGTKLLFAVALLIIGLRLTALVPWAVRAARVWALAAMGYVVFEAVIFFLMMPQQVAYYNALLDNETMSRTIYGVSWAFWILLDLVYPIILFVLLRQGRTKAVSS